MTQIENLAHATAAQRLLADIASAAAAIASVKARLAEHTAERDEAIRAALRTGVPRTEIAEAAGVKAARLYQINDGRR